MIELQSVGKRYGKSWAVRNVSFAASNGEIIGLLGQNGAGKTTTLNVMTGYLPPTEGSVRIGGTDLKENPRECKRQIGYMPEHPPLYDEMTVLEYLRFVCRLREVVRKEMDAHIEEIMSLCALTDVRNQVIGHLSKGYCQRAGIAQALCGAPPILIFDEPTAGLDPRQVTEVRELIKKLGETHTVIFSSHILTEVQQICSKAVILHEGRMLRPIDLTHEDRSVRRLRLTAAGPKQKILAALKTLPFILQVQVTAESHECVSLLAECSAESDMQAQVRIFRLFAAMDIPVVEMLEVHQTLEEIFLKATSGEWQTGDDLN